VTSGSLRVIAGPFDGALDSGTATKWRAHRTEIRLKDGWRELGSLAERLRIVTKAFCFRAASQQARCEAWPKPNTDARFRPNLQFGGDANKVYSVDRNCEQDWKKASKLASHA
jgi:hypothetical protein